MNRLPSAKILILEDQPLALLELEDTLAKVGARNLLPFSSVEEAIAYLEAETPDTAIVDMLLHNQSSAEAVEALLAADVPLLVYSEVKPDPSNASEVIFAKLPWVRKPADPSVIYEALQGVCLARRAR